MQKNLKNYSNELCLSVLFFFLAITNIVFLAIKLNIPVK